MQPPLSRLLSLPAALARARNDAAGLPARCARLHPAMLSGAHNPWGYAGRLLDSWSVLELCEAPAVLNLVEQLIGPDIVLWDSALLLPAHRAADLRWLAGEPSWWPAEPLSGALVLLDLTTPHDCSSASALAYDVREASALQPAVAEAIGTASTWLCMRYMAATSHFNRDPEFAPNRALAAREPLINYTNRPIWLVRGADRADSDFVTGFNAATPSWAAYGAAGAAASRAFNSTGDQTCQTCQ
jgi:hypothetical protein